MTWLEFLFNLLITLVLSIANACDIVLIVSSFAKRNWVLFIVTSFFLTLNIAILALAWFR